MAEAGVDDRTIHTGDGTELLLPLEAIVPRGDEGVA
jgi:hypothetical protein